MSLGAVSSQLMLHAYAQGIFPMAETAADPELFWVDPKRRGILPLDRFHISRSMRQFLQCQSITATLNKNFDVKNFSFIERNFVSKSVRYGWDNNNNEGYNNLNLLKNFLIKNNLPSSKFTIFDFDNDVLPSKKFDIVLSLFSLDYHYNFDVYSDYLKKISHKNTLVIFDTIRADYFKNIFREVDIISNRINTVHKSKRVACSNFLL